MKNLMNLQNPIVSTVRNLLLIAATAFVFAACSMHDEPPEPAFYNGGGSADATTKTDGAAVNQTAFEDARNGSLSATATTKIDGSDLGDPETGDAYNGGSDDEPTTKTDAGVLPNEAEIDALPEGQNPGLHPHFENADDLADPAQFDERVNGFEGSAKAKDKVDGKNLPKPAQVSR